MLNKLLAILLMCFSMSAIAEGQIQKAQCGEFRVTQQYVKGTWVMTVDKISGVWAMIDGERGDKVRSYVNITGTQRIDLVQNSDYTVSFVLYHDKYDWAAVRPAQVEVCK